MGTNEGRTRSRHLPDRQTFEILQTRDHPRPGRLAIHYRHSLYFQINNDNVHDSNPMVIPIIIISPETQFDILYQIEFQVQPEAEIQLPLIEVLARFQFAALDA